MIYGLLAALGWGISDLLAAIVCRHIGSRLATVLAHVAGLAGFVVLYVLLRPEWGLGATDALILAGIGTFAGVAYFALYRGLELGPIALVSPIASAFASVTVLLAVVFLGESLHGAVLAGVLMTLVGVVLASADLRRLETEAKLHRRGIPFAIAAMIGFGIAAFATGSYAQRFGWLPPVLMARIGSLWLIVLAVLASRRRSSVGPERRRMLASPAVADPPRRSVPTARWVALALAVGCADVLGLSMYARGSELGFVSITAAASATFTLLPVSGGILVFGERPASSQVLGIVLVVGGLVLLGVGA